MLGGALRLAGKLIGPGLRGRLGGARGLQNLANHHYHQVNDQSFFQTDYIFLQLKY